jgi:hypothetical protein
MIEWLVCVLHAFVNNIGEEKKEEGNDDVNAWNDKGQPLNFHDQKILIDKFFDFMKVKRVLRDKINQFLCIKKPKTNWRIKDSIKFDIIRVN